MHDIVLHEWKVTTIRIWFHYEAFLHFLSLPSCGWMTDELMMPIYQFETSSTIFTNLSNYVTLPDLVLIAPLSKFDDTCIDGSMTTWPLWCLDLSSSFLSIDPLWWIPNHALGSHHNRTISPHWCIHIYFQILMRNLSDAPMNTIWCHLESLYEINERNYYILLNRILLVFFFFSEIVDGYFPHFDGAISPSTSNYWFLDAAHSIVVNAHTRFVRLTPCSHLALLVHMSIHSSDFEINFDSNGAATWQ